jgi:serralysin
LFELAKTDSGYASTLTPVTSLDGGGDSPMPGLVADATGHLFGTASGNAPQQNSEPNSTVWEIANSGFVPTTSGGGGGTTGATLTADDSAGQHLTGTANDDTFFAGHNSVVMTGNGGADAFVFQYEPWNAGSITDFTPGNDKLDLSALLSAAGYSGSDPVSDGYVTFQSDGGGDTNVYFNPHDPSQQWPSLITTLDNVSPSGLTAANTLGTASSSSGGGGGTGGGTTGETLTANDTAGQQLTGTPNDDIFNAGHNSVVMTGDGGADRFVFQYLPWNAGSITDFNTADDVLNLKAIFASIGYTGHDPVADGYLAFHGDGSGDTQVIVNPQGPGTEIPITVTTLNHVDPSMIHASDYIFA